MAERNSNWPRIQPVGRLRPMWWYRAKGYGYELKDRLNLLAALTKPGAEPAVLSGMLAWSFGHAATPPVVEPSEPVLAAINVVAYIAVLIVAALISYAMAPKPPIPTPAALADFNAPTAEEGREIGVIFGEYLDKSPNVLWWGDLGIEPITKKAGK